jgi:hypothetical protein
MTPVPLGWARTVKRVKAQRAPEMEQANITTKSP